MRVSRIVESGAPSRRSESGIPTAGRCSRSDVATDGHDVIALEDEAAWDVDDQVWQQKIEPDNLRRIAGLLSRGGWAALVLPNLEHVEVNPDRLSGRPTIRGRRVPVEVVAQIADEPGGIDELREGFDLNDDEINDARQWWQAVREYAEAA